jgi:acyl-CoA synthetase (AMP-forming)/AMP-acid ligase II
MNFATLRDVLVHYTEADPAAPFLIAPGNPAAPDQIVTFGGLQRLAEALAAELAGMGLAQGDNIALFLENNCTTASLFLAAMSAGYVVTPINLRASKPQLTYVLDHCDCQIAFVSNETHGQFTDALALVSRPFQVKMIDGDHLSRFGAKGAVQPRHRPLAAGDRALLIYTSGTTGKPKGVVLTHAQLLAAATTVIAWHGLTRADRVFNSLPLYHINGQVVATLAPFVSGGSVVIPHRFSVSQFWNEVVRFNCTWINVVPTIIAYLLNAAEGEPDREFPSLRFGRSASAPLAREHHVAFEKKFSLAIVEGMGMTESASVVFCNPMPPDRRKMGSVGLACNVDAHIIDATGRALPDGQVGEIIFRSRSLMDGYYKAPDETQAAIDRDGYMHTGDLGYRDADGYFFITGRIKELIIKGGENIAPREIDEALLSHPAILEAAAVGMPDPYYGQEILAAVVLKPGAQCDEAELRAHCLTILGRYKTPRVFRFVDDLPKGPSGKIQRLALLQR